MFRTELDRAITDPGPVAPATTDPGRASRNITVAGRAARGGPVIAPGGPQPSHLGDDSLVYDDGVLRITRIPGPRPGPGPRLAPGLGRAPGPGPAYGVGSGYALAGEIDDSTVGPLAGKLAEIAADLDEVHLDLGELDYSDLAGLRVIVQLAAAGGRHVVLHHVPPHLRAILGILGWDTAPGLELAS